MAFHHWGYTVEEMYFQGKPMFCRWSWQTLILFYFKKESLAHQSHIFWWEIARFCFATHSIFTFCPRMKPLLWTKSNLVWAKSHIFKFWVQNIGTTQLHYFFFYFYVRLVSKWREKIGQSGFMTNSISNFPQHCSFCHGTPHK